MNISSKQQGSALVIVIIILVVGVIGALGYVFWSNYLAPKDETQQVNNAPTSSEDETTNVAPNTYENETYSFQYPEEYWSVSEERDENINIGRITPVIKTDNWEQTGMGLDAGAQVAIYTSEATRSLSQLKDDAATFADGAARDLEDTTVDGIEAFSYKLSYEGERYQTVFVRNGIQYNVVYQYADTIDPSLYLNGYETVLTSLKFK